MFRSARIKLTAWYLLIIMSVSIVFSFAFYQVSTMEIQRIIHRIERWQEINIFPLPPPGNIEYNLMELNEAKNRLKIILLFINFGIFVIAGAAGYFLAGRTLKPIEEMLQEQNRFITDSSHELRTPLTALRAEMEASLLDGKLSLKEAKRTISSNLEEVINLQSLSDNLLQLAQYENNSSGNYQKVYLLETVEDSLKKIISLAKKKKIIINNEVDDYQIYGDKQSLIQLFRIILDNAIKYSPVKTTITISSKRIDHKIEINFKDEGIGISDKDLPHIFDRLYRADVSRSQSKNSGYGLGLSIAKKIIENHNGLIKVESVLKKGSVFTVILPVLTT